MFLSKQLSSFVSLRSLYPLLSRPLHSFSTTSTSSAEQQYGHTFILRFHFPSDGYYHSTLDQYRSQFIQQLNQMSKQNSRGERSKEGAIALGGDSFPFGTTTIFINCSSPEIAQQFAKSNVYTTKNLATYELTELEGRLTNNTISNLANFYQIKMDL